MPTLTQTVVGAVVEKAKQPETKSMIGDLIGSDTKKKIEEKHGMFKEAKKAIALFMTNAWLCFFHYFGCGILKYCCKGCFNLIGSVIFFIVVFLPFSVTLLGPLFVWSTNDEFTKLNNRLDQKYYNNGTIIKNGKITSKETEHGTRTKTTITVEYKVGTADGMKTLESKFDLPKSSSKKHKVNNTVNLRILLPAYPKSARLDQELQQALANQHELSRCRCNLCHFLMSIVALIIPLAILYIILADPLVVVIWLFLTVLELNIAYHISKRVRDIELTQRLCHATDISAISTKEDNQEYQQMGEEQQSDNTPVVICKYYDFFTDEKPPNLCRLIIQFCRSRPSTIVAANAEQSLVKDQDTLMEAPIFTKPDCLSRILMIFHSSLAKLYR